MIEEEGSPSIKEYSAVTDRLIESLNDALSFNYSKINWFFSKLSSAYGSAIIAALSKDKKHIKIKDILKGDYLVSSWSYN